jgi:hypothetical protein
MMTRESAFQWLSEHVLGLWWVRYLLIPAIQAGPAAIIVLDIGLGAHVIWGFEAPYAVLCASVWSGLSCALIAGFDRMIAIPVERLKRERDELLRLIGYVRTIVGFKSHRFHETASSLSDPVNPIAAFFTITQPDAQIREIIRAVHDFFAANSEPAEAIKVSLMEWEDNGRCLAFLTYFPDSQRPKSRPDAFKDASTIAGKAYFHNNIVVSESLSQDESYQHFGPKDSGSMFAYPIYDADESRVALIVNVVSDKVNRFRKRDSDVLKIPMQVFGERLLLEYRLRGLLHRAKRYKEV